MLELRYVVDHLDEVRAQLARRGPKAAASLELVSELAHKRRGLTQRVDALRAQQNDANAAMAKLDKKSDAFRERRDALRAIAQEVKALEPQQRELEAELEALMLLLPNLPSPHV